MSNYKSFALAGANGHIGKHILKAFLSVGINPLILTRKTSNTDTALPSSLTVAKVDIDNVEEIAEVLKKHGIEVVVSAIAGSAFDAQQKALADAAKEAGVKLFAPSEFGGVTEGANRAPNAHPTSPLVQKDRFAEYLKSKGLPWTRFFTGAFHGFVPWFGAVEENGKFNIAKGTNDVVFSATDEDDIGGFVAYVLTTLAPKDLEYRSFRISGEEITFETAGKRLGKEIEYVDKVPGSGPVAEVRNLLLGVVYSGQGTTRWDHEINGVRENANDNHVWAGHEWKKL
ncbi:endo- -beta-xylanase precursor [Moniliophthora roreri MCA 2997]|uniref:Endo--beta-xylanase n=1 Tax=Moniliophthora roreri (strain MCA 2997) TaxID=1381753 RepID=V2X6K0_MONRO|nr:endo- -beta-xylanase precursor [Moniliophthora roreri MCA 2997]